MSVYYVSNAYTPASTTTTYHVSAPSPRRCCCSTGHPTYRVVYKNDVDRRRMEDAKRAVEAVQAVEAAKAARLAEEAEASFQAAATVDVCERTGPTYYVTL